MMRKRKSSLYEAIVSNKVREYAEKLPHLIGWQVRMAEDGCTAKAELKYSISESEEVVTLTIPINLPYPVESSSIKRPEQSNLYNTFIEYKSVINTAMGFFGGEATGYLIARVVFSKSSYGGPEYLHLFSLVIGAIYIAPSFIREASRLFLKHPVNRINHIASLLLENKEYEATKEIRGFKNEDTMELRRTAVRYTRSLYDPEFLFKYYYVNAYVAFVIKQYDISGNYFRKALPLAKSEQECFIVHKDYINLLNARIAIADPHAIDPFEKEIIQALKGISRRGVSETISRVLKEKLMSVLEKLIHQQGKEAATELDKIQWGEFYNRVYPNLAAFYYGLKQILYLCNEKVEYDKSLDIETAFRNAYKCKKLSSKFELECTTDNNRTVSASLVEYKQPSQKLIEDEDISRQSESTSFCHP